MIIVWTCDGKMLVPLSATGKLYVTFNGYPGGINRWK